MDVIELFTNKTQKLYMDLKNEVLITMQNGKVIYTGNTTQLSLIYKHLQSVVNNNEIHVDFENTQSTWILNTENPHSALLIYHNGDKMKARLFKVVDEIELIFECDVVFGDIYRLYELIGAWIKDNHMTI